MLIYQRGAPGLESGADISSATIGGMAVARRPLIPFVGAMLDPSISIRRREKLDR